MTFHQLYNAIKDINFNRPIISKLPERIGSSHRGNPVFRIPRTLPQSTHHETEADFYYVEFIVEKKVIVDLIEVSLHDIKDAKL